MRLKKCPFYAHSRTQTQLSTGVDISCINEFLCTEGIFMITPRLDMILQNIKSDSVADIGTDHAFIPIALAKRGANVIATDANPGPLISAKKNIEKYGLDITLLLGDGLSPLKKGDVKEIIIAGMGGELIKTIISNDIETAHSARLLLQPMNAQPELRRFLFESGFKITSEDLSKEGRKVYNLIVAESGFSVLPTTELDLHLPPALYNHPLFSLLIEKKEREFSKRLNGLSAGKNADYAEIERLRKLLLDTKKLKLEIDIKRK